VAFERKGENKKGEIKSKKQKQGVFTLIGQKKVKTYC